MKKYFEIYFSSFKQSLLHKPTALIMLMSMIIVATFVCGLASRILVSSLESYYTAINREAIQFEGVKNYTSILDYMFSLQDELTLPDDSEFISIGDMSMTSYNAEIIYDNEQNSSVTKRVTTLIELEVFDKLHTNDAIENGEKVMIVNREFLESSGAQVGQVINFMGSDFEIIAENNLMTRTGAFEDGQVSIPYSAEINVEEAITVDSDGFPLSEEEKTGCAIGFIDFDFLERNLNRSEVKALTALGAEVHVTNVFKSRYTELIMMIGFLVGSCLAIVSTMNYWQKINDRKYAVYKTLGASPAVVAGVMVSETFVVASVSVGIGLLIEYLVSLTIVIGFIDSWIWLHYLILFSATLFSVMIMMITKIIKRARAVPASKTTFG